MKKPFFTLMSIERNQFASDFLFETALELENLELENPLLKCFEKLVNETESSQMKHVVKMVQGALRAKKDIDLVLDFDNKRAENAALKELFLETTSSQNSELATLCFELKKFLKSRSHADRGEVFEKAILANTGTLIEIYFNNLTDPEGFHREKKIWLNDFNQAKQSKKLRAVHV